LCLMPVWTGGPVYAVFQGNVYDQQMYLSASAMYRIHDYAFLSSLDRGTITDPVLRNAQMMLGNRPAVNIVHAASLGILGIPVIASAYAYLAALQANMMFAATFVFLNVFKARLPLALLLGAALTLGFFRQYVFDINAWGLLAGQPAYLLMIAAMAFVLRPEPFDSDYIWALVRSASTFGVLLTIGIYLYIEQLTIYGPAGLAAVLATLAVTPHTMRRQLTLPIAALCAASAAALAAALLYYEGTFGYLFRVVTGQALADLDWWQYYHAHLRGRDLQGYLTSRQHESWLIVSYAMFSHVVHAAIAVAGLYHVLPSAWPLAIAAVYNLALFGFVILLFGGAAYVVVRHIWAQPIDVRSTMLTACVVAMAAPVLILCMGRYWSAGKALSMVSPLLFVLLAAPLLPPWFGARPVRVASVAFVLVQLGLGVARPIAAADSTGGGLIGFPKGGEQATAQKLDQQWDYDYWTGSLLHCHHVMIDVENKYLNRLFAIAAADLNVSWSAARSDLVGRDKIASVRPEFMDRADCMATTRMVKASVDQRLIWLDKTRSTFDYLEGRSNELEIGVTDAAGVRARGLHQVELHFGGRLRWTTADASFDIPNDPGSPPQTLRMELWPVVINPTAKLTLKVDQRILYEGAFPSSPIEWPLTGAAGRDFLSIDILVTPPQRARNDPRELGLALKSLQLRR